MRIFAVYDHRLGGYTTPFVFQTEGMAWRWFADQLADPSNPMCRWPQDYELHVVGSFDKQSGKVVGDEIASLVASADVVLEQLRSGQGDIEMTPAGEAFLNDAVLQEQEERVKASAASDEKQV